MSTPREPLPSFRPFWRFLGWIFVLVLAIAGASALLALALEP